VQLVESAELDNFTVSSWARTVLIAEARKVLRRALRRVNYFCRRRNAANRRSHGRQGGR